ncbi:MAG: hypothetical protein ACHQ50_01690 [Fimbriimonadales bacterium]
MRSRKRLWIAIGALCTPLFGVASWPGKKTSGDADRQMWSSYTEP